MEIKRINSKLARKLFASYSCNVLGSKYKPLGCFFIKERNGHFSAIDNTDGYAWCEEFTSYEKMVQWFNGYPVTDVHGYILNI